MPRKIIATSEEASPYTRQIVRDRKIQLGVSDPMRENGRLRQESALLRKKCEDVFFCERNGGRPDPTMVKALLLDAERTVIACDKIVEHQRAIVNELRSDDRDAREARSVLHALLNTQALLVLIRDRLLGVLSD